MLKNIKDILKTMGEALTFANAGEMLGKKEKGKVLAAQQKHLSTQSDAMPSQKTLTGNQGFAIESIDSPIALHH